MHQRERLWGAAERDFQHPLLQRTKNEIAPKVQLGPQFKVKEIVPPRKHPRHAPRILVEDNGINQKVVLAQLAKLKCKSELAINGLIHECGMPPQIK